MGENSCNVLLISSKSFPRKFRLKFRSGPSQLLQSKLYTGENFKSQKNPQLSLRHKLNLGYYSSITAKGCS